MSFSEATLRGVSVQYGARKVERTIGIKRTSGTRVEYIVELDGEFVGDGFEIASVVIPAGSKPVEAMLKVDEAFDLGGTTPTIVVGTNGTEETNGLVVSEAQAEATGMYDLTSTLTGTWADVLAADTTIGVTLGGTTPTSDDTVGKATLVVTCTRVN